MPLRGGVQAAHDETQADEHGPVAIGLEQIPGEDRERAKDQQNDHQNWHPTSAFTNRVSDWWGVTRRRCNTARRAASRTRWRVGRGRLPGLGALRSSSSAGFALRRCHEKTSVGDEPTRQRSVRQAKL